MIRKKHRFNFRLSETEKSLWDQIAARIYQREVSAIVMTALRALQRQLDENTARTNVHIANEKLGKARQTAGDQADKNKRKKAHA